VDSTYAGRVTPTEAIAQLNRHIWRPFIAAYAGLDIEAFRAIHAPDLVRVQVGSGWIGGRDEYIADTAPRFAKAQGLGDQFRISFRFSERIIGAALAYERGVFEMTIERPNDPDTTYYGRFDTVSRRDGGVWRFILDKDDDEGGTLDAAMYHRAAAIDDLASVRLVNDDLG